jgi:hypothetical protein
MAANAINIRELELDESLVALGSCRRDPHPCDINMGTIKKAPIFPYKIFGIAKYAIQ